MSKSRPKWFQPDIFSSPSLNDTDFTVFSKDFSLKENPAPSVSSTSSADDTSLKEALWEEIHQFKTEKLYAEALACFHTLFEKKYADNYTFYELADIYFLMNDYTRSLNWLQKFQVAEPENCKGFLLQARIFLQLGKKDDLVNLRFVDGEKILKVTVANFKDNIPFLTDEPEVWGVEELDSSAVIFRVVAKCEPTKHFEVQRQMKKEIKIALDKNGIKIPYTQIEVHNEK